MSEHTPVRRDSDDARSDAGPPTDAVTDDVKEASADTGGAQPTTPSGQRAEAGSDAAETGDEPAPEPGPAASTGQVDAGSAQEQAVEGDAS